MHSSSRRSCKQERADDACSTSSRGSISSENRDSHLFKDEKRDSVCMQGFRRLRSDGQLFDVILLVDGREFECHRALLAASSEYFRCMFTSDLAERDQKVISISGVDSTSMSLVVDYLYSGQAQLHAGTVQNLLSAANLFGLDELKHGCAEFMGRKLDSDNSIGIYFFASAHKCNRLERKAWDMITENFDEVAQCSEFLELSADSIIDILECVELETTEEGVFEAALAWLQHSPEERSSQVYKVFKEVSFGLMEDHYFFDHAMSNPVLKAEPRLAALFEQVTKYKLLKDRWIETDLDLVPRHGVNYCRVAVYTAYLDDEKKQVLQLYGQRCDIFTSHHGNVLCDLPSDLENPALLVTGDNELYVAGGDQSSTAMYRWGSSPEAGFDKMAVMTIPRKQFCLVQVDQFIYAVGGCNSDGNLSSVIEYSESQDQWKNVASMPKALRCFCAVAFGGKLYVFGGESEKVNKKVLRGKTELSKSALCYDPRDDKWTVLAEMSVARALAGCTVFKNKIYVIGGFGSITESWIKDTSPECVLDSVEIYDPLTNTWSEGPRLPVPLCSMGVVKYYHTIFIMGGENEDDVSNMVYALSKEGKWERQDEMVTGVTEITIHSSYAIMNLYMDSD